MKCGNCQRNTIRNSDQARKIERRADGRPAHQHRQRAGDGADGRVRRACAS